MQYLANLNKPVLSVFLVVLATIIIYAWLARRSAKAN